MDAEFEEGPAADDLQIGQDDATDVDVRYQDVAGHFANVLQESQVEVLVLQPRQLQIAVDVRAIGVAVAQIPVVVLAVRRHRHPTVRTDTNCPPKSFIFVFNKTVSIYQIFGTNH